MHGSPWAYDARGAARSSTARGASSRGRYDAPARHQDIAPTILALLGRPRAPTMTGAPLAGRARVPAAAPPRAVLLVVLDAFRADYLGRLAAAHPLAAGPRRRVVRARARVDYLPTATGVAHATISTGADPGVHGIVVNNFFDAASGKAVDAFADGTSKNLDGAGAGGPLDGRHRREGHRRRPGRLLLRRGRPGRPRRLPPGRAAGVRRRLRSQDRALGDRDPTASASPRRWPGARRRRCGRARAGSGAATPSATRTTSAAAPSSPATRPTR